MVLRNPAIPGAAERRIAIDTPDAGRIEIAYAELGEGDESVLLIHGWPQHAGCWRGVAPALAKRYRVICPDLRGFGLSDTPGVGYDPAVYAEDYILLLDALGIDRVHVAGHDWGGFAGFVMALEHPDRVSSYLALNTFSPWIGASAKVARGMWRSWYTVALALFGSVVLRHMPSVIARGLQADAVHPGMSDAAARGYAAVISEPARAHASARLYRGFVRRGLAATRGGPYKGQRLTVPTHFLFGEKDRWVARTATTGFERNSDDGTLEFIPDSGHFIQEEKPQLVTDRALALFGRVG